jgi:hypothetical protein
MQGEAEQGDSKKDMHKSRESSLTRAPNHASVVLGRIETFHTVASKVSLCPGGRSKRNIFFISFDLIIRGSHHVIAC